MSYIHSCHYQQRLVVKITSKPTDLWLSSYRELRVQENHSENHRKERERSGDVKLIQLPDVKVLSQLEVGKETTQKPHAYSGNSAAFSLATTSCEGNEMVGQVIRE